MARDHGFRCEGQMQGQMHVHVTEMDPPVPLLGHFFRHPPAVGEHFPCFLLTLPSRSSMCTLWLFSISVIGRVLLEVF
ncbi:hypothetical protein BM536_033350 [Streptomyces phaeoluteigriseus]|uniref:Uncharacterized protein n=1 Tax=Streptomyces phaeoluteigriseus TaxID=114686 RepID=A0A1V6MKF1_9ACTN|nr:hypothetical protein BM536_033350 [Streptomyces phaeoluteigriseus]